ncbi:MAG TPA: hypothetical protein VFB36_13565 [Nevskiaceae bacterium]|nr:hypothetical protein [Nevskiaceae bacterium]
MKRQILIGCCVALLAGCGGNDGPGDSGLCQPIGGGGGTVTTSPGTGASFSNADKVFDGDLNSSGSVSGLGLGNSSIQGTAQSGVVVAQGLVAGILIDRDAQSFDNLHLTITTFLDGVQADTGLAVSTSSRDGFGFFGIMTTQPYDAIRATFTTGQNAGSVTLYELCVADFSS